MVQHRQSDSESMAVRTTQINNSQSDLALAAGNVGVIRSEFSDRSPEMSEADNLPLGRDISKLRLLFAVDSNFPGLGGAERQALKLAIALRERGASVEFVCPRIFASQALEESYHGFTIRRLDYPHIRWLGSLILMRRFAQYLCDNKANFDAVHIHVTHLMAASAGYARQQSGMPVVTKISGFYEFEGGVLDQRKRFKPLNMLLRTGLRKVDFVQTISVQTREKLIDAGFRSEQIQFIPNGIDTRPAPVIRDTLSGVTIGYCGRLREVKGVHVLLDAFAALLQQRPDEGLQLSIAGNGEASADLVAQARDLGITDHVQWLGVIDDTATFFQSIDIYVQPSFAEGLPNSVMEAMVEQRPVIATDIGGNKDLVDHEVSGLLFPSGDSEALTQQLLRLVDDQPLRDSVARAGRDLIVERFGFDKVVDQLAELYCV